MKIEVEHDSLKIIPENIQDEIWLENVLGLKNTKNRAVCYRENASGLSCWAYAVVEKANLDNVG